MFLLGCAGDPPQPPPEPSADERVVLAGWELIRRERGPSRFFYQRPLRSRVNRLEDVWEPVQAALHEVLGEPPLLGVDWYVFAPADYDGALAVLAEVDGPALLLESGGIYHGGGEYPGIYLKSTMLETPVGAASTAAHELAHAWARELANGRPVPAWFNEGLAEIIGLRAAERADPGRAGRVAFAELAAMVALERRGAMPGLESLVRYADLRAEGRKLNAVYVFARCATEEILSAIGPGAARKILQAVGSGDTFEQALTAQGVAADVLEARIDARMLSLALQFPPGLQLQAVSAGEMEIVWVGLVPGTRVDWTAHGPLGCVAREASLASVAGVATWTFGPGVHRACAGAWELAASAPMIRDETARFTWASGR